MPQLKVVVAFALLTDSFASLKRLFLISVAFT